MQTLLYWVAKAIVTAIQLLPIELVARIGRAGGAIAGVLDKRHRLVARTNLGNAFPEKAEAEIEALVREHFRRLGENYTCAVKTAGMKIEDVLARCEISGVERLATTSGKNRIIAIGHFGNFELYAMFAKRLPQYRSATTYRAFKQPGLTRLLEELRNRSGCLFYERRSGLRELLRALSHNNVALGLLSDQHAGRKGVWGPFFGMECSTNPAVAVLALRYNAPLNTGICYRTGLARWSLEIGPEIPTHENGAARSIKAIMADVNIAFEQAIRRDPPNWFWVHRRWKPRGVRPSSQPS